VIDLTDVAYAYPDTDRYVLQHLDLAVPRGSVTGIVGASSSGKTTLAKILSGFIPSSEGGELSGGVVIDGVSISEIPLPEAVSHVGLVIQNPFNQISGAKFTVREELAFGLENSGIAREEMARRIEEVATRLRITHLLERSPYELSGGQMQLVAIGSMIVMQTAVLVMDEPTSQLDPGGTRMVFDIISELTATGATVVIFEHKLELLRDHADHIHVLADGRLVLDGEPREVLADARLEKWRIGSTRYTRAGRAARKRGLLEDGGTPPVSLEDAVEIFSKPAVPPSRRKAGE
jgi:energy-coupling factor transporter ATP-binding protein EcfA2